MTQLRAAGDLMPISEGSTARYFSTGTDPQLYLPALPSPDGDQPLRIEIWIRILFDLRAITLPLIPIPPGSAQMDLALKESREHAAEMARQRDDAFVRNGLLQDQLTEVHAEVRRQQASFEQQVQSERNATRAEVRSQQTRFEQQLQLERNARMALLNSFSWRITRPLRRLYDIVKGLRLGQE